MSVNNKIFNFISKYYIILCLLIFVGCQKPQLTGAGATYSITGKADDGDAGNGGPFTYSFTTLRPGWATDGNTLAASNPAAHDKLQGTSLAYIGNNSTSAPQADTDDTATSNFNAPNRGRCAIEFTSSSTVYLTSGGGSHMTMTAVITNPLGINMGNWSKEFRFRLKPGDPNTIRVFTGPRGGTHINEIPNGSNFVAINTQPNKFKLPSGNYTISFNLKTHSDAEYYAYISSTASVKLQ